MRGELGQALEALKNGKRVSRAGWHGKGMWVYLEKAPSNQTGLVLEPCLVLRTPTGHLQPGWLASQADMLSEDWLLVG